MAADPQVVIDKSLRSVFGKMVFLEIRLFKLRLQLNELIIFFTVGNIPYDVTEEKLKDIFSEAGPVVSFK